MRGHRLRELVLSLKEHRYARCASRIMLRSYQRVRRKNGQLRGKALYEQILIERSRLDCSDAPGILLRAEQSYCHWPVRRELRYRDVVHYVLVSEYLRSNPTRRGTLANMGAIVARVIPAEL